MTHPRPEYDRPKRMRKRLGVLSLVAFALASGTIAAPAYAGISQNSGNAGAYNDSKELLPQTQFTMAPDGSSGLTSTGEQIPNIDSVKATVRAYYGDPGSGVASKSSSRYIDEVNEIVQAKTSELRSRYDKAIKNGQRPALVFDVDDTTLWTYDLVAQTLKFNSNPTVENEWIQNRKFAAVPAMVGLVNEAAQMGYNIFAVSDRDTSQETATVQNLADAGYAAFTADNVYTRWADNAQQPNYVSCAQTNCTKVEYESGTRAHIESLGYSILDSYGDQWSELMGGHTQSTTKIPNPTYYSPSPDLAGMQEPRLAPQTRFTMAADGSSGLTASGEEIANLDSAKKTIRTYYGDLGSGQTDMEKSQYAKDMQAIFEAEKRRLKTEYGKAVKNGEKPALVFDSDDTTLLNYPLEVDMGFSFQSALSQQWVAAQQFGPTPHSLEFIQYAQSLGYEIFGITGRRLYQRADTIANLHRAGFTMFTEDNYFTKWDRGAPTPDYITCDPNTCSTIEFKSQTRAHLEDIGYTIVGNYGDQFSDLIGGSTQHTTKLPNPTYYLP